MKTLRKLCAVIALTFAFTFAAFADCPPPVPGEMNSPPCSSAQVVPDDPLTATESSLSSTSNSDVVEISVTTIDVLLSALSLF